MNHTLHKICLFVCLAFWVFKSTGQEAVIHGTVHDGDSLLAFATVEVLDEAGLATATDSKGNFSFAVPPDTYTLKASYVGMIPMRKSVIVGTGDTMHIDFDLSENTQLSEVVITGTMKSSYVADSPVKIDVIGARQMETYIPSASASVVDGISLINGVEEVVACGVCFTNTISINGLPGQYTALLIDGMPMFGNLASVYGLNGIPNMMIDRFEVIKGPSSTLYGSEAMAGVINIVTKDPAAQPVLEVDLMATSHKEVFGNLAVAPRIGRSNGYIGVNYAYINDFDDRNADGFGDVANLDRISLFTKWNIHRKSGLPFSIAGKYYYEDRRNGVREYLENRNYEDLRGSDEIYGESIYTKRIELFGTYGFSSHLKFDYSFSHHDQDSYYGSDHYVADQQVAFGNFIYNRSTGKHDLTGGLTLRYQSYDDNTVATEMITDSAVVNLPDNQFIPGVFVQDEWSVGRRWTLMPGLRVDYYREHGLIPAPRLSAKFDATDWTTVRVNFGTGFKIVNLFTEDHAFITGQREVIISEDLLPERSINLTASVNHIFNLGSAAGTLDVDAYYTNFTNKIIPDYGNPGQIIYANSDGSARTIGASATVNLNFNFPLGLQLGFNGQSATQLEVTDDGSEERQDVEYAPKFTGLITANYRFRKLDMVLAYTARITGPIALPEVFDLDTEGNPMPEPRPVTSETFSLHSIQVTKRFNQTWEVYAGITNLFDFIQPYSPLTGFNDPNSNPGFSDNFDTAYAYGVTHGRELYLGVKMKLGRER
jgi:outer membrane receptor for ferrienterochelin and colicins